MTTKRRRKMDKKHGFWMRYRNPITGKTVCSPTMATVFIPREDVALEITEHGVVRSKKLRGRGSTQFCSGAICTVEQADRFSHEVTGTVDFQDSRVFIASHETGHGPDECYGYMHDAPWFPKENDKKDGHDKILQRIKENGGQPLIINLSPIRIQPPATKKKSGDSGQKKKKTGLHLRAGRIDRDFAPGDL